MIHRLFLMPGGNAVLSPAAGSGIEIFGRETVLEVFYIIHKTKEYFSYIEDKI